MITEARRLTRELDVSPQFQVCDAHSLTFKDASFDVCRAERVFLYLENPATAIVEMARVTRSGGHVIVFDFDWGAWFIDSDFAPMARHIEALLASEPRNPAIGRELPHLMRKAELKVVAIEPMTLLPTLAIARRLYAAALAKGVKTGVFTAVDVEAWWREQETMEQDGRFYHAHHFTSLRRRNPRSTSTAKPAALESNEGVAVSQNSAPIRKKLMCCGPTRP